MGLPSGYQPWPFQSQALQPPCAQHPTGQKPALCKVRVVFSKPVHAVRLWGCPPGTNHGLFKAKPSSHHVHSTLPVTPPTSPCPTLSADAEPARKQCAVLCNQKCTIGFNGLNDNKCMHDDTCGRCIPIT